MNTLLILFLTLLKCDYMPADSGCVSLYDPNRPPAIEKMPIHLTNYWVYDENGNILSGWEGQCDANCSVMANGTVVPPTIHNNPLIDHSAACINSWVGIYYTTAVTVPGYGEVVCNDAFGRESYQQPFFHERKGHWVVPVDWFGPRPFYDTVYGWSIRRVATGN